MALSVSYYLSEERDCCVTNLVSAGQCDGSPSDIAQIVMLNEVVGVTPFLLYG